MTDAPAAPITEEVKLRETGRHPNIIGHRQRMADRIDADDAEALKAFCGGKPAGN